LSTGRAEHLRTAGRWLMIVACAFVSHTPALAVPPPPPRADLALMLTPNGSEQVVRENVRAYQPVPVSFAAQAGDRLLIRFEDDDRVLVLQVEAPSGLPWFSGVMPGPDGIDLWFQQAGVYRLLVIMSADAARSGRSAKFELGLRLRR